MEHFLRYHRQMFILTLVISLLALGGLAILLPGDYPRLAGFASGSVAQLLKFGLLDRATIQNIAKQPQNAARVQLRATFFGLVVFGLALVLVFSLHLDVWCLAGGIFLPRLVLLADSILRPNPFGEMSESSAETTEQPQSGDTGPEV
ncbi:MAG: hypothetical protein LBU79_06195 [Planctomycetota bacterium]|jgi:hypothetical protein|nr:hypothetical protein [Planctomycetota bacterium]